MLGKKKGQSKKRSQAAESAIVGLKYKVTSTIHSMPKQFVDVAEQKNGKGKKTGLLILTGGALFLVAIFGFLYYYFTQSTSDPTLDSLLSLSRKREVNSTPQANVGLPEEENNLPTDKEDETKEDTAAPPDNVGNSGEETSSSSPAIATSSPPATEDKAASSTPSEEAAPRELRPAVDTDGDGLYNVEEKLLGSDHLLIDSDGDGYYDRDELLNLYNPAGEGSIIANPNILRYTNPSYRYTLYYPDAWSIEALGGDESVMIKTEDNQFIQIIVTPNPDKLSIDDWYRKQFDILVIKNDQKYYKQGWEGIKSVDGLNIYLTRPDSDYIFTLSYNLGLTDILNYANIFEFMVKSFELGN